MYQGKLIFSTVIFMWAAAAAFGQPANQIATQAPVVGAIESITVDDPLDVYSAGTITVGGQTVILPRNLVLDLPANRLTVQQLFDQAPTACKAVGQTGLAATDTCVAPCGPGAVASILANRMVGCELVIAGEVFLEKGQETLSGTVTEIDYTDGFFRVNGTTGTPGSGVMVRFNDPDGRHSVQQGLGCDGISPNCSADPRFTEDPDNYTHTFSTGYPVCIPSTVSGIGNRTVGSDVTGLGDPLCPQDNRNFAPVPDSSLFAPLRVGDPVALEGNYETVGGATFFSSHTMGAGVALFTDLGQPDYMIFDEVELDVAGFQNQRARILLIGFTTLADSQLDIFGVHLDTSNVEQEVPLASTVGNPNTTGQGIPPNGFGIFKIRYDIDFITGAPVKAGLSACENLLNAGFAVCPGGSTMDEEFALVSPVPRDLIGRTRNAGTAGPSFDILGNVAPNGQYLNPVGIGHPEFVEINLNAVDTPFIFAGEPWLLDRRLGPGGCVGGCPGTPQPLIPFPFSGLDPRTRAGAPGVPTGSADQIFAFAPFGPTDFLAWPPDPGCAGAINLPPVAAADDGTTDTVTPITIDVLANDLDPNGDPLSVSAFDAVSVQGGTVVDLGGGNLEYTAAAAFVGIDTFDYTVTDGALFATETVTITVNSGPVVDILDITRAEFRSGKNEWRVEGTATVTTNNVVTIYAGMAVGGTVIGTAAVDPVTGAWQFREKDSSSPGSSFVSVDSTAGGQQLAFPVN